MSDIDTTSTEAPADVPAEPETTQVDPAEAIRAEVHREYAGRLAQAELRAQAALDGIAFPDGFLGLLDMYKLLGDDGEPCADAIALALKPFQATRSRNSLSFRESATTAAPEASPLQFLSTPATDNHPEATWHRPTRIRRPLPSFQRSGIRHFLPSMIRYLFGLPRFAATGSMRAPSEPRVMSSASTVWRLRP
ncbi:hypothetical protein [Kitasatospora griseola]|uniref:hypothetical protein n=1 Tax=Kitasatospora griseola TaxID=2064 RepID=UPI0013791661|nr:hypothetical protein [Kitasatospora griseola]